MRDKKRFIPAILITTVMLFVSGCGKQVEPVSAEPTETIKEVDTEESMESSEAPDNSEKEEIVEDEAVVEDEEIVEEATETKTETTTTNGSSGSTNSSSSGSGTENVQPATPEPAQPVHTHTWKEHTVTNQVWVPNIVVVDDYEYRVVGHVDAVAVCNCGYTTTDSSAMESHVMNHVFAGENTQFTVREGHDVVEEVKVGSHEEDKGHYETQTYVDYYYCDCGATK